MLDDECRHAKNKATLPEAQIYDRAQFLEDFTMRTFLRAGKFARLFLSSAFLLALLWLRTTALSAQNCPVIHHPAPSEADAAFAAGKFSQAADLYRSALAKNPEQSGAAEGLIHSLLRQQKVLEAADTVHSLIGDKQPSASLLTLRAEVELRQGEPWAAASTAVAALKLDPCNPQTILILARLSALNSRNATAQKLLASAHQLDPEDPEIRSAWINSLPPAERIPQLESYVAIGGGSEALNDQRQQLEQLKAWVADPHPPCTLTSKVGSSEIPFSSLRTVHGDTAFPAIDIQVNHHNARLSIDTSYNPRLPIDGMSGLLILKSAAEKMGLKPLFKNMVPGIGWQGPRPGYVAYADAISIGNLEFHNCAVQVMEPDFWSDADGSISLNLLSDFLVTLDYPAHKLLLDPLPPLPGNSPAGAVIDRYIAPEMKDYTPLYRAGSDLILPVIVNRKFPMLFLVDTSMAFTMLSAEAAHEINDGHKDSRYEVRSTNGRIDYTFSAGDVALSFANMTQNVSHIATFDTTRFTRDGEMEVSGFLADATLRQMKVHLDFRDSLIKMEFDPQHPNVYALR